MAKPNRQQKIRQQLRSNPNWVRAENQRRLNQRQRTQQRIRNINQRNRQQAAAQNAENFASPSYESNEGFQRDLATNQARYEQTLAGLDDQERQLGVNYGVGQYGGDIASNPYSRAALLQRSYNQNQRASTNTLASRGQLYAGSASNAFNTNRFNFAQAQDALQKDYRARLGQIAGQRQAAENTLSDANETANREAVNDASKLFPVTRENAPRPIQPVKKTLPKFRPTTVFRPKQNPKRGR